MLNPSDFYKNQLTLHQTEVKKLFKTLSLYSILRLTVFILTVTGIYFTYNNWKTASLKIL